MADPNHDPTDQATPPSEGGSKPPAPMPRASHTPAGTGTLGMWLFLAAVGMLFAASMIAYVILRFRLHNTPAHTALDVPWEIFLLSTVVILFASFTLHRAVAAVRSERLDRLRSLLIATLVLAAVFVVVQVPAMAQLTAEHFAYLDAKQQGEPAGLFGLVAFLVLIHALHVVGGVVPLLAVTRQAHRHAYDHEHYGPVRYTAMYWHFLDAVWIVMFLTFVLTA